MRPSRPKPSPQRVNVASHRPRTTISGAGDAVTTPPTFDPPAPLQARTAEAPLLPLGDQLYQRLLRERIVFLGQQVDDDISNRICSELLLLAAEDSRRDIYLYVNSPGG